MRTRGVAAVVVLAAFAVGGRAEDSPPAKPAAPLWSDHVYGELAVSRDGAWVGGHTTDGFRLFPTAGGTPVTLELPKDERGGFSSAFTPDSKWFVATGQSNYVEVQGVDKDRTQSVFFFSVAEPKKRKAIQITLKPEKLDKRIRKHMASGSGMKTLHGAVVDVVPFAGARVLLDRGSEGLELWDVAAASKVAVPSLVDSASSCGLSADAAQFVITTDTGLEVREVKGNRAIRTIRLTTEPKQTVDVEKPRMAPGSAGVVAVFVPARGKAYDDPVETDVCCWSVADGTKRWDTPIGKVKSVSRLEVTPEWTVAVADGTLRLLDMRDGSALAGAPQGRKCTDAVPSADGKALWIADDRGISRVDLPSPAAK